VSEVSTFNSQKSITSVKGGNGNSRVRYIKVTVTYKVQVGVQQSVPGVQFYGPRRWCFAPRVLSYAGSIQVRCCLLDSVGIAHWAFKDMSVLGIDQCIWHDWTLKN